LTAAAAVETLPAEDGMQWINDARTYGWLSIALHWLAAIAVFAMFYLGFSAEMAGEAGDREGRAAFMGLHISFGAAFALLLLARVAASYLQPRPAPVEQTPTLQLIARATHQLLLLAILIQIVSGPLAVWSGGRAIHVFDLFAIPSPFAERNEGVHEIAGFFHAIGRWMLIVLIGVHVLGALKHALINRDGVMRRMLAPTKA
jgi:cytochrome b561